MASKTEIANYALSLYGEPPVLNIDPPESNRAARIMALRFDSVRDAVLRAHPWNFAVARAKLNKLVDKPPFGFEAAFALPTDFLRVVRVNEASGFANYKLERLKGSRVLLSNDSEINLIYISRVKETGLFDPLFTEALAARLAADTVYAVTQSRELVSDLWTLYRQKLAEARTIDSMEDPTQELEFDDFTDARLGIHGHRPIASSS
jgi:hypothetical protein